MWDTVFDGSAEADIQDAILQWFGDKELYAVDSVREMSGVRKRNEQRWDRDPCVGVQADPVVARKEKIAGLKLKWSY